MCALTLTANGNKINAILFIIPPVTVVTAKFMLGKSHSLGGRGMWGGTERANLLPAQHSVSSQC